MTPILIGMPILLILAWSYLPLDLIPVTFRGDVSSVNLISKIENSSLMQKIENPASTNGENITIEDNRTLGYSGQDKLAIDSKGNL